jgi:hypothetical protein
MHHRSCRAVGEEPTERWTVHACNLQAARTAAEAHVATECVRPETECLRPDTECLRPETECLRPETECLRPETECLRPERLQQELAARAATALSCGRTGC